MDADYLTEEKWEKKLKIRTLGGANHEADGENYPYEPTPYSVLVRLAKSGILSWNNTLVDYGCGMGRAALLLSHLTRCKLIGIDYNSRLIDLAAKNLKTSGMEGITFIHEKAEDYEVEDADAFFFNPFSEVIPKKVINQILWS